MRPGWYIITYHNVDYEDSLLTRALGGTVRPDVFHHHLETLAGLGRFIDIPEGRRLLDSGAPITEPLFSLWFDDGFAGVRRHALPLCRSMDIRPAMAVCSRFVQQTELFWRCKLSFLACTGALDALRARISDLRGFQAEHVPKRLRIATLHHFCDELVARIDELFAQHTTGSFRDHALCIFDTRDGVSALADAGWLITNHSAAHYPLAPHLGWSAIEHQFAECEPLVRSYNPEHPFWVIPFAYGAGHYMDKLQARALVVDAGEQPNTHKTWRTTGRLLRYSAPATRDIRGRIA